VGFLVEPQNQGARFINGLASKPLGWFVRDLASKLLGWFVSGLASKPLGRVSRFGSKNGSYGLVIWASKSP
jgi:hypothetical protein